MDLTTIGIDIAAVIAIGSITEYIKNHDHDNRFKRFYVLIPVVLSAAVAVGFAFAQENFNSVFIDTIKYFGISSFGYTFIKNIIINKNKSTTE